MASPDVQTSQSRARRSPSDDIVTPQSSRVSTPRHNPSMSNSTTSSSQNITASPSSSYRPSTTQLTLDGVLAAHGGNAQAALEALLQDRNTLQSQNTQLWKLIEKSRVAYSTLGKDFERVRADRDKALARLEKYSSGGHRSHSSSAGNSSQQRTESPAPIIPNPNRPPQPHRHQSDDSSMSPFVVTFLRVHLLKFLTL
jgi:RalA-binding protein 1